MHTNWVYCKDMTDCNVPMVMDFYGNNNAQCQIKNVVRYTGVERLTVHLSHVRFSMSHPQRGKNKTHMLNHTPTHRRTHSLSSSLPLSYKHASSWIASACRGELQIHIIRHFGKGESTWAIVRSSLTSWPVWPCCCQSLRSLLFESGISTPFTSLWVRHIGTVHFSVWVRNIGTVHFSV